MLSSNYSNTDGMVEFTMRVVAENEKPVRTRGEGARWWLPHVNMRAWLALQRRCRLWKSMHPILNNQPPPPTAAATHTQLSDIQVVEVRDLIERLVSTSSMSVRPAIYGMVAERELERLARCGRAAGSAGLVFGVKGGGVAAVPGKKQAGGWGAGCVGASAPHLTPTQPQLETPTASPRAWP